MIEFENHKNINDKLNSVDIYNRPLEFFGVLLYLKNQLDFQVQEVDLYELMIENYLNQGKLDEEKTYNNNLQGNKSTNNKQQPPKLKQNYTNSPTYTNKF